MPSGTPLSLLSPVESSHQDHLQALLNGCESGLERDWLRFLDERNLRLPPKAQPYLEAFKTRPDFVYDRVAVYVDGPHHEYPDRHQRDREQTEVLEDAGWMVIRFGLKDDWEKIVSQYKSVFGG